MSAIAKYATICLFALIVSLEANPQEYHWNIYRSPYANDQSKFANVNDRKSRGTFENPERSRQDATFPGISTSRPSPQESAGYYAYKLHLEDSNDAKSASNGLRATGKVEDVQRERADRNGPAREQIETILLEDLENTSDLEMMNALEEKIVASAEIPEEARRVVRQVRRQQPGFFWTLARVAFETFNDTRSAVQQISSILNEAIVPDPVPTKTPAMGRSQSSPTPGEGNDATTPEGSEEDSGEFQLTRSLLLRIIGRNLRGLVRLFNIEWRDALNQSDVTAKEFERDLGNQIRPFFADNPDAL